VVKTVLAFISWFGVAVCGVAAVAAAPEPWGIHLQDPASPIMHEIYDFHTMLMWIIV
jgi:heme/copper-type cytochrome/quinol oxidase subunit 2